MKRARGLPRLGYLGRPLLPPRWCCRIGRHGRGMLPAAYRLPLRPHRVSGQRGHLSGSDRPDGRGRRPAGHGAGVTADAIYSGFLGSAGQIGLIEDFYRQFRRGERTLVLVDPVMGTTRALPHLHAGAVRAYGIWRPRRTITPNLTERRCCWRRTTPICPGTRRAAGVAGAAEPGWAALSGAHRGEPPAGRHRRGLLDRATRAHPFLLWPGRSPPSSPAPATFSPAWCWGRCLRGSHGDSGPSGRRVVSGAGHTLALGTPVPGGSSSSRCWEADAEIKGIPCRRGRRPRD